MTARIMTGHSAIAFAEQENVSILSAMEDGINIFFEKKTIVAVLGEPVFAEDVNKISVAIEDFPCENKIVLAPDFEKIAEKALTKRGFECVRG